MNSLIGKNVTFFCLNYIYYGKLITYTESCVILENAHIVYETGPFDSKEFKDIQFVAKEFRLNLATIESYGILDKKVGG